MPDSKETMEQYHLQLSMPASRLGDTCDFKDPSRSKKVANKQLMKRGSRVRKHSATGGGQRAYVSAQLKKRNLNLSHAGVAHMLNSEYNNLDAELKRPYLATGKEGTALKRNPLFRKKDVSVFGTINRRKSEMHANQNFRISVWRRQVGMSFSDKVEDIARSCGTGRWSPEVMKKTLATVRFQQRQNNSSDVVRQHQDKECLAKWQANEGQQLVDAFLKSGRRPELLGNNTLEVFPAMLPLSGTIRIVADVGECTSDVASWAAENSQSTNIQAALLQKSRQDSMPIMSSSCRELPHGASKKDSKKRVVTCKEAGVCIAHSVDARRLFRFAQCFNNELKQFFPVGDRRASMLDGFSVVLVTNEPGKAKNPASTDVMPAAEYQSFWLHVGLAYFSPWRLTFHFMQQIDTCRERYPELVLLEASAYLYHRY